MARMRFNREMYPKTALIKAAYNFTDSAYVHLDADDSYYYVDIEGKIEGLEVSERDFANEMLTQCVRHEVYRQTKGIRELLLARAMATSVIVDETLAEDGEEDCPFVESEILRDWFSRNENDDR